jgi:hypothetical protein
MASTAAARYAPCDGGMPGADGGVTSIFPIEPLLEHHPQIDYFIGVNCCYPERFDSAKPGGRSRRSYNPLRRRRRDGERLELARMALSSIEDRCLLLQPVPYNEIKQGNLYEQLADRGRWPEFVVRGYYNGRRNIALLDKRPPATAATARATR